MPDCDDRLTSTQYGRSHRATGMSVWLRGGKPRYFTGGGHKCPRITYANRSAMRAIMCRDHLGNPVDQHLVGGQRSQHFGFNRREVAFRIAAIGFDLG